MNAGRGTLWSLDGEQGERKGEVSEQCCCHLWSSHTSWSKLTPGDSAGTAWVSPWSFTQSEYHSFVQKYIIDCTSKMPLQPNCTGRAHMRSCWCPRVWFLGVSPSCLNYPLKSVLVSPLPTTRLSNESTPCSFSIWITASSQVPLSRMKCVLHSPFLQWKHFPSQAFFPLKEIRSLVP